MTMPIVTLTSGLRVANFSSPHTFLFTDGTELPACTAERTNASKLDTIETEHAGIAGTIDIEIVFKLTDTVREEIAKAQEAECDVVLVPFPLLTAMKAEGLDLGKCRVIRSADRITKAIHTDRFCV